MLFFYIRHGDPIYDPDSLTPLGHRQAEAAAKRLSRYGLDRIYASTSNRAMLTAEYTCKALNKPMTTEEFANEGRAWEYLALDLDNGGKTWAFLHPQLRKMFIHPEVLALGRQWYDHPAFQAYELKKGFTRLQTESDEFLAQLGYVHIPGTGTYRAVAPTDDRVALFAHHGFGLGFLSNLLDIPYPVFSTHFDINHTGITVIEFNQEQDTDIVIPKIITLSSDSHLYHEGVPSLYPIGQF